MFNLNYIRFREGYASLVLCSCYVIVCGLNTPLEQFRTPQGEDFRTS
jgi:hypothetical protein